MHLYVYWYNRHIINKQRYSKMETREITISIDTDWTIEGNRLHGKLINDIKAVRETTGLGIREAKDFVLRNSVRTFTVSFPFSDSVEYLKERGYIVASKDDIGDLLEKASRMALKVGRPDVAIAINNVMAKLG